MDGTEPIKCAGIEVPMEERTPLVDRLLRAIEELQAENRQLRDEIGRLKGLPPRPKLRPSTLNEPDPSRKKKRRGKRPGSAKRQKTRRLIIHETIPVSASSPSTFSLLRSSTWSSSFCERLR